MRLSAVYLMKSWIWACERKVGFWALALYPHPSAAQGGGRSGDDATGRDIMGDNGSSADDGMVADMDAFEDDGAAANPDMITNGDRLCNWRRAADAVQVGIHDNDIPGDHAVAANADLLLGDDFGIAVEIGRSEERRVGKSVDLGG